MLTKRNKICHVCAQRRSASRTGRGDERRTKPDGRPLALVDDALGAHASNTLETQLAKAQLVEHGVLVLRKGRQLDEKV